LKLRERGGISISILFNRFALTPCLLSGRYSHIGVFAWLINRIRLPAHASIANSDTHAFTPLHELEQSQRIANTEGDKPVRSLTHSFEEKRPVSVLVVRIPFPESIPALSFVLRPFFVSIRASSGQHWTTQAIPLAL
jgi:hypothetical protein